MSIEKEISQVQREDPIQTAESILGKDRDIKEVGIFSLALQMDKSKRLNKLLDSIDDTKFSETEEEYLRKVRDFGFEIVLKEPFLNEDQIEERFYILWHKDLYILMCFDTFTWGDDGSWAKAGKEIPPASRNGGNIYYNWVPSKDSISHNLLSSGGFTTHVKSDFSGVMENPEKNPAYTFVDESWDSFVERSSQYRERDRQFCQKNGLVKVWTGSADCREAIKTHIKLLMEEGTFIKWYKPQFLWLLHYMDSKEPGYDYVAINKVRIAKLPLEVQECLRYEE